MLTPGTIGGGARFEDAAAAFSEKDLLLEELTRRGIDEAVAGHLLEESRQPIAEEVWLRIEDEASAHLKPKE